MKGFTLIQFKYVKSARNSKTEESYYETNRQRLQNSTGSSGLSRSQIQHVVGSLWPSIFQLSHLKTFLPNTICLQKKLLECTGENLNWFQGIQFGIGSLTQRLKGSTAPEHLYLQRKLILFSINYHYLAVQNSVFTGDTFLYGTPRVPSSYEREIKV